jgi:hypothetical protein
MNKPINKQLELVSVATVNGAPPTDPVLLAALGRAAVPPADAERLIAQGEPEPDEFDWNTPDESIVVAPRPGIAIYRNRYDDVVVRVQNTSAIYDEDHFAYIRPESLPAVIKALKECLP